MFDVERFVADCRALQAQGDNQAAIRERLEKELRDPAAIIKAVGEPKRGGLNTLYTGPDLTVLNLVWPPYIQIMPHNHQMWAVIGIYTGREDNIYWRRVADDPHGRVEAAGAQALADKDCAPLGRNIIHSVTNPIPRHTGAIHIYGGDFFHEPRSEWDPGTLRELPYDPAKTVRMFEEANARAAAS